MIGRILQSGVPKKLAATRTAADKARDAKKFKNAALLYEEILQIEPNDAAIHVQCGHMFKEAGELGRAEHHYDCAKQLMPDDPDLWLQFGHFYKVAGRLEDAERAYKRAMELEPDWPEPTIELAALYRGGWRGSTGKWRNGFPATAGGWIGAADPTPAEVIQYRLAFDQGLVPELAPKPPESKLFAHIEEIAVSQFGVIERTRWGICNVVRGVDAIRGFCISATPIVEMRASLGGLRFHAGALHAFPLKYEKYDPDLCKYVFNIWYDFSQFREGHYEAELRFVDVSGRIQVYNKPIVIAAPLDAADYPQSNRLVSLPAGDDRPLEERVNAQPSVIRPARRGRFPTPPKNVLVIRVDQLGDIVISIPAIRRLRELLPRARLVGLLSLANVDLAKTLDLFDEVVAVDLPEDEWEQRRVMPLDKQSELRQRLAPFSFDVAIDLSISEMSRPLSPLSGAPFLVGFKDKNSPWLSAYIEGVTQDPRNRLQEIAYSTQVLGLVEWFGVLLADGGRSRIIQREDLSTDRIAAYGVLPGDRFAVLHTGARLKFSRWPHYGELASMLLDRTELRIVMMTDDSQLRARLPPDLLASDRFRLVEERLPFDDLDALLSFCTVFVGNDSGPGHLASLRGANVVNLFLARHNWNEWGHENRGYVITRRVPCAGCQIYHSPEECGKEFACITNISPQEVFDTLMEFV